HSAFRRTISDFQILYETTPSVIAADFHPDYLSTKFAHQLAAGTSNEGSTNSVVAVQHHLAHVLSCMAENEIPYPVVGVSWDGTGYGSDGTIWGGEFFLVTEDKIERIAHIARFRLPGGERAVKEPRRTALGLLYEVFGNDIFERNELASIAAFAGKELEHLKAMLAVGLNSPVTTSAGRLFDGVASLVALRQRVSFEGQAAMELEFALNGIETDEAYPISISGAIEQLPLRVDWCPMIRAMLKDIESGTRVGIISARFHNGLAEAIVEVAKRIGEERVV